MKSNKQKRIGEIVAVLFSGHGLGCVVIKESGFERRLMQQLSHAAALWLRLLMLEARAGK